MKLNAHQLAAVTSDAEQLLIRAGAGTGKTETLVSRALTLAERFPRVRLVTFTRRAARVLRQRVAASDVDGCFKARIEIDTHHGLATGILRRHGALSGLGDRWTVIDGAEQREIERAAGAQLDLPSAVARRNRLLTYADLLPGALDLLSGWQEVRDAECGGALLVDEGHDSEALERALDAALAPESLTVVGDDAQRIYGWRGAQALPGGMPWVELDLPVNYRSHREIIDLANLLPIRGRVDLRAERGPGGEVRSVCLDTDAALVDYLLDTTDIALCPERWAILSRTHHRLEYVADTLRAEGIPVHAPGLSAKLWETKAARSLLDHLHVVANPHDSLHLARVLQAAGWEALDLLRAEAGRAGSVQSLWDWACANVDPGSRAAERLRLIALARQEQGDAQRAAELFSGLYGTWAVPEGLTVTEFLAWVADPSKDDPDDQGEGVYLGTIHSAKGGEWPGVVLLGMEEGSIPAARWKTERRDERERIEEERRLLYVGITRARDSLILASARTREAKWGPGHTTTPSRFLAELGLE